jgi:MFS superfamily sulfate permease-like transporter
MVSTVLVVIFPRPFSHDSHSNAIVFAYWFTLMQDVSITAIDTLTELHSELAARGITFAMTRVKQDLYKQLKRSQLLQKIGSEHIYLTLHTAIAAFQAREHHFSQETSDILPTLA